MPRSEQCAYKESRRRCVRNASGRSPFCKAHELVARDAAKKTEDRGGFATAAADILDDVLSGRGIRRDKVAEALNQAAWELGGDYVKYAPEIGTVDWNQVFPPGTRFRAGPGPQANRRSQVPPRHDPDAEIKRALLEAKRTLGFSPSDPITKDILRERHRQLAKRHHPDRGGSVHRMQEINAAVDVVAASL